MYFVQNVYLCTKIVNIMKKIFTLFALCALTLAANAAYHRFYNTAVTAVSVDTLADTDKNRFTLTISQTCKNRGEYSKPTTVYENTVKLVLHSADRTLEGVYTTEGADPDYDSNNYNKEKISIYYSNGPSDRHLRTDSISTFVIGKNEYGEYYIGECTLHFTTSKFNTTDTWTYDYCYDPDEILNEGISPRPFIFSYSGEYVTDVYNYDLTPNSFNVVRDDTDYEGKRYFLTIGCSGKCRETNDERNYEVQLAIYPDEANIAGSYATQGGAHLLWSQNSYVKDLQITKQRNLANDSVSSVSIVSKGNNKYTLTGGPLICTDVDLNYQAVYGKKRIEAVRYYYFNDNGGEGIDFTYNEETGESGIATGIDNTPFPSGEGRGEALKLFRNGQLLIERNGLYYNMQGTVIR